MAQDRNGNNHKAAGRPDGGQFDRKAGQGADDDLAAGDGRPSTPTADELSRVADAIGADADAFMLQLPDGTVAGCYRTDGPIRGPLPDGWHVYDTMESEEGWNEDEGDWTDLPVPTITIDNQPVAHIVNQGPKLVTRHDLSGVDREFDEDHWWMDGHTLGGDLELVRNESEWRGSIAADCGLDPDDLDDPDVFNEAAVDYLMADSLKAANGAAYSPGVSSQLLRMSQRLYVKDMDRDFHVPMPADHGGLERLTGGRGLDDPEIREAAECGGFRPGDRYVMFNADGDLVGLNDEQARQAAWTSRRAILQAARHDATPGDARILHESLHTDRDWTAWDNWEEPEERESLH